MVGILSQGHHQKDPPFTGTASCGAPRKQLQLFRLCLDHLQNSQGDPKGDIGDAKGIIVCVCMYIYNIFSTLLHKMCQRSKEKSYCKDFIKLDPMKECLK